MDGINSPICNFGANIMHACWRLSSLDHAWSCLINADAYISHSIPWSSHRSIINLHPNMAGAPRGLLLGVCAALMAIAVASAASDGAASVVVGLAKCADCTRKNMKAEAAFKGTCT
jgi:hypothetical protein